jgi:hypothetical protein
VSLFFAYVEIRHRGIPLTAVETDITIVLETPRGDRATVTRTQRLRANHENVTGYSRTVQSTGVIPSNSIEFNVDHCSRTKQKLEIDGSPQSWEVIHRFDPIPRNLLKLGRNTVTRTEKFVVNDGFVEAEESYEMLVPPRYRHDRIRITVFFHPDNACDIEDCEALLISENGVVEVNLTRPPNWVVTGRPGVQPTVARPRGGDRYRVKWRNAQAPAAVPGALTPPNELQSII